MAIRKIFFLVSIMIFLVQLAAASSQVSIPDASTTSGGIVTLPITINGAATVSSATVTLSYDPAVVVVKSVSAGNLGTFSANIDNATGITTISAFSVTGASGNITLANVTFRAAGSAGSAGSLNLAISSLKDVNGIDIPFTTNNGTFTIIAGATPLGAEAGGPYSGIAGTGVQFSGSANGGTSPYTYSWNFGDGSTSNLQNPIHSYSNTGSYTAVLTVTDASSSVSDSAPVNIISAGGAIVSVSTVQSFASSISIAQINVSNVQNLGAATVKLSYNPSLVVVQSVSAGTIGAPVASINNVTGITTISVISPTGASGNVVLASINLRAVGSVNSNSPLGITVTALSDKTTGNPISYTINNGTFTIIPGTAPLTADAGGPYSGNAGSAIPFTGSASGGTPPYTSYYWNFGDGSTSSQQNPTHTYSSGGTYNVQLTVQDSTGANASANAIANIVGGGALISINSVNLTVNNTASVSIKVENVLNLAAMTLTLSYNSSVVIVKNVGPGFFGSPTSNINNAGGTTTLSVFSPVTSGSGNITIATLTLNGTGIGSSPLTLIVTAFTDLNGVPISKSIKSGTANVLSVIKGDVDGNGIVNIIDALFIAQYTVNLRTLTQAQRAAADVNGDDIVNIIDALFIAQYTVGLRQL